jgi:carboxymethylenebutenolidase
MEQKYIDLFDRYTHGSMARREFLEKLAGIAGSAAAASVLLTKLENNYASAAMVAEDDPRLTVEMAEFDTGKGKVSGYLVKQKQAGKMPGVIVIHENRGLNPHIKDVARRMALEGFLTLAPDYLSLSGGTPADEDQARDMIAKLTPADALTVSRTAVTFLATRPENNGKVGAVGFCWGGGQVNQLAAAEPKLAAGVAYYGRQPAADQVPNIQAAMLLHYAGLDEGINKGIAAYEEALKSSAKTYELYMYEGANHAFNNDTNAARYNKAAADLAWSRTVAFLKKYTAGAA